MKKIYIILIIIFDCNLLCMEEEYPDIDTLFAAWISAFPQTPENSDGFKFQLDVEASAVITCSHGCDGIFASQHELCKHIVANHNINIETTIKLNKEIGWYECTICQRIISETLEGASEHSRNKHQLYACKKYECALSTILCTRHAFDKHTCTNVLKSNDLHQCLKPECLGICFLNDEGYLRHMLSVHGKIVPSGLVSDTSLDPNITENMNYNEVLVTCPGGCQEIFTSKKELLKHALEHHAFDKKTTIVLNEGTGNYRCALCGKINTTENAASDHVKNSHQLNTCPFNTCLYHNGFFSRRVIDRHECGKGEKTKRFPRCPDAGCLGISFATEYGLKRHNGAVHGVIKNGTNTLKKKRIK